MAKKIKQFRYYGNNKNNSDGLSNRQLVSGSFLHNYLPILQLGIQSLPGTKFYLNGSSQPIIIGSTGIYELNIQGLTEINSIQFDNASISLIDSNESAYLIIDILYEGVVN